MPAPRYGASEHGSKDDRIRPEAALCTRAIFAFVPWTTVIHHHEVEGREGNDSLAQVPPLREVLAFVNPVDDSSPHVPASPVAFVDKAVQPFRCDHGRPRPILRHEPAGLAVDLFVGHLHLTPRSYAIPILTINFPENLS